MKKWYAIYEIENIKNYTLRFHADDFETRKDAEEFIEERCNKGEMWTIIEYYT